MSNGKGNTLLAFLLGGVVGAGIALFYAPDSGYETRRRIRENFDDAEDWAREKLNDTRDKIEDGSGKVKEMISDRKESIKSAIDAGKDAYYRGKDKFLKEKV